MRLILKTESANTQAYSSQNGGRFAITLTRAESNGSAFTLVEGKFAAELFPFKRNAAPITVDDGVFHWAP